MTPYAQVLSHYIQKLLKDNPYMLNSTLDLIKIIKSTNFEGNQWEIYIGDVKAMITNILNEKAVEALQFLERNLSQNLDSMSSY